MQMHDINEFARRLRISRRMTELLLARGELPAPVRLGRLRRWADDQIDSYIRKRVEALGGDGTGRRGPGRPRDSGA